MSATTVSQLAPLQDALAAAVRASLPLAADARLPFVRRHLRATIDGTPLPIAEGERAGPPAALTAELNELSKLLTKVVNGARDKPGWRNERCRGRARHHGRTDCRHNGHALAIAWQVSAEHNAQHLAKEARWAIEQQGVHEIDGAGSEDTHTAAAVDENAVDGEPCL